MNFKKVLCFDYSSKSFEEKDWRSLEIGEFVKVRKEEQFPADLVFLKCSEKNGIAFVDTMNLDGEVFFSLKFLRISLCFRPIWKKNWCSLTLRRKIWKRSSISKDLSIARLRMSFLRALTLRSIFFKENNGILFRVHWGFVEKH